FLSVVLHFFEIEGALMMASIGAMSAGYLAEQLGARKL
ncbi:branched-chain amino acid ABC transporter permease, partial [Vibrio vulnificus]